MPITALEAHQSRKIGPDFREYVYIVTGTDDEVAAQNAAAAKPRATGPCRSAQ